MRVAFRVVLVAAVPAVCLMGSPTTGHSEPTLDTSFGASGFVRTDLQTSSRDEPFDLLVQPDGMILTAGISEATVFDWFLGMTRHFPDGRPDSLAFGVNGRVAVRFTLRDQANAIALQADGKIVAAGKQASSNAFSAIIPSIYRCNADGTPDATFASGGVNATRFEPVSSGEAAGVMVTPEGKILAAGSMNANANGGHNGFAFRRLLPDGSEDPSYGSAGGFSGTVVFQCPPTVPQVSFSRPAVAFTPEGSVTIASHANDAGQLEFVVMRVDSGGVSVPFGSSAFLFTDIAATSGTNMALALLEGGKFLLAGTAPRLVAPTEHVISVFRFLSDGTLDPSFGTSGRTDIQASTTQTHRLKDLVVTLEGKIVVAGQHGQDAILARLTADGAMDPTFGTNGIALLDVSQGGGTGYLTALHVVDGSSLLGAGYDFTVRAGDFLLARFGVATVGVREGAPTAGFALHRPYPNPSSAPTTFAFDLPRECHVSLEIFDPTGRRVTELASGRRGPGRHVAAWAAGRPGNGPSPSGVYFACFTARDDAGRVVYRASSRVMRLR